ncbi:MAG: DNA-primase RepB domain-containing protein [Sulfuritalea sp.]|nr:DNA-primase RepB domain-containing protein [Sulfuritalea sp.]
MNLPNIIAAQRFFDLLGRGENFAIQTFDDHSKRKDRRLVTVMHGTLNQHAEVMIRLNAAGAGVFVTINQTDGTGRATANIIRVRSLFVDLDGAPIEPVMAHVMPPSIVIESSPNRYHAYWLTDDCALDQFKPAQQRLIQQFNGDKSVCDLPRVMRLPGFIHQKAEPFMTRIIFPE